MRIAPARFHLGGCHGSLGLSRRAHGPGPEVSSPQGVIAYALPEDLSVLDRDWHPSERQDFRDFLDKGVMGYGASGPTVRVLLVNLIQWRLANQSFPKKNELFTQVSLLWLRGVYIFLTRKSFIIH